MDLSDNVRHMSALFRQHKESKAGLVPHGFVVGKKRKERNGRWKGQGRVSGENE